MKKKTCYACLKEGRGMDRDGFRQACWIMLCVQACMEKNGTERSYRCKNVSVREPESESCQVGQVPSFLSPQDASRHNACCCLFWVWESGHVPPVPPV